MNNDLVERIKKITLKALVSDDYLLENLTFKGGNALNMFHDIKQRASRDIDFSIEEDFSESFEDVKERVKRVLEATFFEEEEKYVVIDFHFENAPEEVSPTLKDFWGGYNIDFKIIDLKSYEENKNSRDSLNRRAVPVSKNGSTRIEIDISKFEYVGEKERHEIDGLIIYVYAPVTILFEKVRAICQQTIEYDQIVKRTRNNPTGRARDFYDINSITEKNPGIDIYSERNQELIQNVFSAKKVPIDYIRLIRGYKELHEENFKSVKGTIGTGTQVESFNFYFDRVVDRLEKLLDVIVKNSLGNINATL
jgi:predicted nucleotidyltransferase component of viral defense system